MASLSSGRQSPFRRQPSTNTQSPLRASTPTTSPTKPSLLSPARGGSLPPDRGSQFVARASQDEAYARPASPSMRTENLFKREGSLSPTKDDLRSSMNKAEADTPVRRFQKDSGISPALSTGTSDVFDSPSTQIQATSPARVRQPVFAPAASIKPAARAGTAYNNIPAPLLRSFRESFEVLDPNATGTLNSSSLSPVLEQLGLSNDTSLSEFFPAGKSSNLNLAAYLDSLSAPYSQLSSPEELAAAFGAFDVDDSGQIDVDDLKQALLRTMPEPGEVNPGARLSERDIDSALQTFTSRRAFGTRSQKAGPPKGDVFKWRDFVSNINGGTNDRAEVAAV